MPFSVGRLEGIEPRCLQPHSAAACRRTKSWEPRISFCVELPRRALAGDARAGEERMPGVWRRQPLPPREDSPGSRSRAEPEDAAALPAALAASRLEAGGGRLQLGLLLLLLRLEPRILNKGSSRFLHLRCIRNCGEVKDPENPSRIDEISSVL